MYANLISACKWTLVILSISLALPTSLSAQVEKIDLDIAGYLCGF